MMINDSSLRSIPIVKRFGRKFSKKFRGLRVEIFKPNDPDQTLRKSVPTETRHSSGAKTVSISAKMWSPEAGKKSY